MVSETHSTASRSTVHSSYHHQTQNLPRLNVDLSATSNSLTKKNLAVQASLKGGPLLKGWVYEDNHLVPGLVVKRFGAVYPHCVVTYVKESAKTPRSVLPLANARVGTLQAKPCTIKKRRTPIIMALTAGKCKTRLLNGWQLTFTSEGEDGLPGKTSLFFEDNASAELWRDTLLTSTDASIELRQSLHNNARDLRQVVSQPSSLDLGNHIAQSQPRMARRGSNSDTSHGEQATLRGVQDASGMQQPPPLSPVISPHAHAFWETSRGWPDPASSGVNADELPMDCDGQGNFQSQRWAKLKHVNGTAVYLEDEDEDGTGGAMMVSAVVRASPGTTCKALLDIKHGRNVGNIFADGVLLESGRDGRDVLLLNLSPGGLIGSVCSPRDLVIARTWRKEDDGTYIMLYQSTTHPAAPAAAKPWWVGGQIRGQVQAAGITISPLCYRPARGQAAHSPECLVTMVLKVDPGGWLSPACWLGRNLPQWVRLAWAEPFVLSIIALRDRVEHARFLVQPFSLVDPDNDNGPGRANTLDLLQYNKTSFLKPSVRKLPNDASGHHLSGPATISARPSCSSLASLARTGEEGPAAVGAPLPDSSTMSANGPGEAIDDSLAAMLHRDAIMYSTGTCDQQYWTCPGSGGYKVRGPSYLKDRKKVLAGEPVFSLSAVDLLRLKAPRQHVAPLLPSLRASSAPFTFIVNILIPGPPHLSLIMSWAADYNPEAIGGDSFFDGDPHPPSSSPSLHEDSDLEPEELPPVDIALARFLAGGDEERNAAFKLIPRIAQGSWIIKQSVGSTPVILGRKLECKYHRGVLEHDDGSSSYLEVDVNVASSSVAAHVVGLVQNTTKSLIVDMAWLIEGTKEDELPEALLGTVRFNFVDLNKYRWMDVETGRVYEQGAEPAHLHNDR